VIVFTLNVICVAAVCSSLRPSHCLKFDVFSTYVSLYLRSLKRESGCRSKMITSLSAQSVGSGTATLCLQPTAMAL
jgi:hypothetical protein